MALRMHRWNWGEASIEATTLTFRIGGMRTSKAQPHRCLHTAVATATTPPPPHHRRRRRRRRRVSWPAGVALGGSSKLWAALSGSGQLWAARLSERSTGLDPKDPTASTQLPPPTASHHLPPSFPPPPAIFPTTLTLTLTLALTLITVTLT